MQSSHLRSLSPGCETGMHLRTARENIETVDRVELIKIKRIKTVIGRLLV
jgi:cobalamin biosynthesis protein CobT